MTDPLPLAPFEEYMWLDDRPSYPMSFFCRFRLSGRFARDAFEAAAAHVLGRHPLLQCVVRPSPRWGHEWVFQTRRTPLVTWRESSLPVWYPEDAFLPLDREGGVKLVVFENHDGTTDLVGHFHHAATDGVGAFRFLEEVLIAYANTWQCSAAPIPLPQIDLRRLERRGAYGFTPTSLIRKVYQTVVSRQDTLKSLLQSATPLEPWTLAESDVPRSRAPAIEVLEFDEMTSEACRRAARQRQTTVNNLLVRDLFLTLQNWRRARGLADANDCLRIAVPINIRTAADASLPAANVVSVVFPSRRPPQLQRAEVLLANLHEELEEIKRCNLAYGFMLHLQYLKCVAGGFDQLTRFEQCVTTSVLTNLVRPLEHSPLPRVKGRLKAGNMVLERVEITPPIRPLTHVGWGVATYAGRMSLTLHYDPAVLSREQSLELMDRFGAQIRRTAGVSAPRTATSIPWLTSDERLLALP